MIRRVALTTAVVAVLLAATAGTATAAPAYGIPARAGGFDVASLLTGRVTLVKADAAVDLPLQTLRVYAYESGVTRGDTTVQASRSWIVRRPGPAPGYGAFAPVTVTGHAGRTAVVATVSQVQVVDPVSSTYLPMAITTRTTGAGSTTTVRASTLLVVSALQLDGTAVDVGAGCATASTLAVRLTGDGGFTDLGGGLLRGSFTVPPFAGCDTARAGTSTLLTRAFSGPGNEVVLARGAAGSWDTAAPRDCTGCGRPPAVG